MRDFEGSRGVFTGLTLLSKLGFWHQVVRKSTCRGLCALASPLLTHFVLFLPPGRNATYTCFRVAGFRSLLN